MAGELFQVDQREMMELIRFFHRAPRKFAKASGYMLNDFAFGVRNTAIEVLRERMTVRDPRFVERRLQVEKSSTRPPFEAQQSEVGSTFFKRFSGWREQQTGERTTRERTINLLARRGSKKRKAVPMARLKPGADFESYHRYPGASVEQQNVTMLQKLDRKRWKRPFLVLGKRGMRPGLYKFYRRKPRLLQVFNPSDPQPNRLPWLTIATDRYFQRVNIGQLWRKKIDRILRGSG